MTSFRPALSLLMVLAGVLAVSGNARAAQSYDNCAGFIDTLPATISTQGTWCVRHDLSTAITSGSAITVATNNVTIDCNDFKVGGLAGGIDTGASGIAADNRLNVTVRHCAIRGFIFGVNIQGGAGALVEDNRVDNATTVGLWVDSDNSIVRRNHVSDTGGNEQGDISGMIVQGDGTLVDDNVVAGVTGSAGAENSANGISFNGYAGLIRGNYVTTILPGAGTAKGMLSNAGYMTVIEQNVIVNPTAAAGDGVDVTTGTNRPVCLNNRVRGFTTSAYDTCIDGGGNSSN